MEIPETSWRQMLRERVYFFLFFVVVVVVRKTSLSGNSGHSFLRIFCPCYGDVRADAASADV